MTKLNKYRVFIMPNNQQLITLGEYTATSKKEAFQIAADDHNIKVDENFAALIIDD